jgi:hypothetical protein
MGMEELKRLEQTIPSTDEDPFLGLVGAWGDDEEIDQFIEDIYRSREQDIPRPVPPLFDDPDN